MQSIIKFRNSYCSQDSLFFLSNTIVISLFYEFGSSHLRQKCTSRVRVESFGHADSSQAIFRVGNQVPKNSDSSPSQSLDPVQYCLV